MSHDTDDETDCTIARLWMTPEWRGMGGRETRELFLAGIWNRDHHRSLPISFFQ